MKILVMGAGVIGVTPAYELLQDGHEVAVVESHEDPAAETTAGKAGPTSAGQAAAGVPPPANPPRTAPATLQCSPLCHVGPAA